MDGSIREDREDRHPGASYEEILESDSRPVPDFLRQGPVPDLGLEPIPASNYFSADYFAKEVERLWPRIWLMACREEEIANVGDFQVFDIAGKSLLIVRTPTGAIKALYNSCLHRGRKLATAAGCKSEFRCPYHGLAWRLDGGFKENPIAWDFPQWRDKDLSLPEAKVDTWGGFVFVNMDREAQPLLDIAGPLAAHFKRYDFTGRYKAVHVVKAVRCNWKVLAEAFMESHHSLTTHPQILPFLADANSQYDLLSDYVSRHFSASGVPSPFVADQEYSPSEIILAMAGQSRRRTSGETSPEVVPPGMTARAFAAQQARLALSAEDGWDYAAASDAEMIDALLYNLWPNMSFWAGYAPNLVYRWRPLGMDPEKSLMDVMILKRIPKDEQRPKPAVTQELGLDEPWSNAPQLGALAGIFDQDMGNLPYVQEGLRAGTGEVHLGRYSEMRIRQMHRLIDRYILDD